MLRLNLLQAKPIEAESDVQEIKESEILSDENFLNQNSETATSEVEMAPAPAVSSEPETEIPEPAKEAEEETEQLEFVFKTKSKFPIVPILVLFLLVVAIGAYFLVSRKPGKSAKAPGTKKQVVAAKPSSNEPAGQEASAEKSPAKTPPAAPAQSGKTPAPSSTPPAPVPLEAKAQRQAGVLAVNVLGKVLSSVPKGTQIGFLSFDGQDFTLELFAAQQNRLEQFLQSTKGAIPASQYKILAKDRSYYQGHIVPHLLISGGLGSSGMIEPGKATLTSGTIRKNLRKLATVHGVRVRELRTASPVLGLRIGFLVYMVHGASSSPPQCSFPKREWSFSPPSRGIHSKAI
jgi:hypothetical protein